MALERVGLAGFLKFDGASAVNAMKPVRNELGQFVSQGKKADTEAKVFTGSLGNLESMFRKLASSIKQAGGALGNSAKAFGGAAGALGTAALPLSAGAGFGLKKAADFEEQMSAVEAVAGASKEEMVQMTNVAKELGATTKFNAVEAAEGLEILARGGFDAKQSMAALPGVMSAAAADAIPIADAADVVTNVINGMNLKASQATDIADVLALTSARTATDIKGLGEGFKYAAAQSKNMGIELPVVAASLGVLADAGLKGSMAGTSFTNMLVKLSKPTKLGAQYMKELGGSIYETQDGSLDLQKTLTSLAPGLEKITSKTKRAARITEIFGIYGQKAVSALDNAITSGKFETLVGELATEMDGTSGAADKMAKVRLDNFKGQVEQLGGAVEGLSLEVFTPFIKNAAPGVERIADAIGNVVKVMIELNSNSKASREELEGKFGPNVVAVAYGIKEGVDTLIRTWNELRTTVGQFFQNVVGSKGPETVQMIAKWVTMIGLVAAAIAPVLVAIAGLTYLFGPLITLVQSLWPIFSGVFSLGMLPVLAGVVGAFLLIRNEGESVGDTLLRVFQMVQNGVMYVVDNAIIPFALGFTEFVMPAVKLVWKTIQDFVAVARTEFQKLFSGVIQAASRLAPLFKGIFAIIGTVVSAFAAGAIYWFGALVDVVKALLKPIRIIANFLIENILNVLIIYVKGAVKLAEAIGFTVPQAFKDFVAGGEFTIKEEVSVDKAAGLDIAKEAAAAAAGATSAVTEQKAAEQKTPEVNANVNIEDKRCLQVSNKVTLDGREQAIATARHQQEVNERSGFKATPWQKRIHAEQGAVPVGGR